MLCCFEVEHGSPSPSLLTISFILFPSGSNHTSLLFPNGSAALNAVSKPLFPLHSRFPRHPQIPLLLLRAPLRNQYRHPQSSGLRQSVRRVDERPRATGRFFLASDLRRSFPRTASAFSTFPNILAFPSLNRFPKGAIKFALTSPYLFFFFISLVYIVSPASFSFIFRQLPFFPPNKPGLRFKFYPSQDVECAHAFPPSFFHLILVLPFTRKRNFRFIPW